jgi:hypothetical protein
MKALVVAFLLFTSISPALSQQKAAKISAKPKTCTYDQCVSVNKARGWDSAAVSRWCSANPGKCDN